MFVRRSLVSGELFENVEFNGLDFPFRPGLGCSKMKISNRSLVGCLNLLDRFVIQGRDNDGALVNGHLMD